MKLAYLLLALFVVGAHCEEEEEVHETEDEFEVEFHQLVNPKDKEKNAAALRDSEDEINEQNKRYNSGNGSFAEALNEMSNMPLEEFEEEKEGATLPDNVESFVGDRIKGVFLPSEDIMNDPVNKAKLDEEYAELDRAAVPDSYDANAQGLVTKAKNQRSCGSCAAFAANGLHETCMLKAGSDKDATDLSEQYLVDCGYNKDSMNGCNGAHPHAYTEFLEKKGGSSPHEAHYVYLDRNPKLKCPKKLSFWKSGSKVVKQFFDYGCNAEKMKKLVYKYGAVMAALYASDKGFSNYKMGVFDKCTKTEINHAVLVTGYGEDTKTGKKYWIIKNSWGGSWGQQGFMRIERGKNMCGIEGICVAAKCKKNGSAETPPTTEKPAEPPNKAECDISKLYGASDINGSYTLTNYDANNKALKAEVKCENSKCRPQHPGPNNACVYICGKDPCTNEI